MPLHLIIALDSLTAAHFGRKNYLYMHYRSSSKHNRQDMASIESIRQRAISKLTRKYGKAFVRYLLTPNHTTNALVPPAVRLLTDAIQSSNDLAELKRFDTAARDIMGGRIQPTELRRVLRAAGGGGGGGRGLGRGSGGGGGGVPPPPTPPPLTPTREEFVKLQEKLATANEEIDAYDKELDRQIQLKDGALKELSKAQESVRKLQASGASSDAVRNLEAALKEAKTKLKKCKKSKAKLLGKSLQQDPLTNELCEAQRKLLLKQKDDLVAELAALTQQVIALKEKLKKQKQRADKLSAEKKDRGVLLKDFETKVIALVAELETQKERYKTLQRQPQTPDTQKRLENCNKRVEKLTGQLEMAKTELSRALSASSGISISAQGEIDELKRQLDVTEAKGVEVVQELQKEKELLEAKKKDLENRIEGLAKSNFDLLDEKKSLEEKITTANTELSRCQDTVKVLEKSMDEALAACKGETARALQGARQEIIDLNNKFKDCKATLELERKNEPRFASSVSTPPLDEAGSGGGAGTTSKPASECETDSMSLTQAILLDPRLGMADIIEYAKRVNYAADKIRYKTKDGQFRLGFGTYDEFCPVNRNVTYQDVKRFYVSKKDWGWVLLKGKKDAKVGYLLKINGKVEGIISSLGGSNYIKTENGENADGTPATNNRGYRSGVTYQREPTDEEKMDIRKKFKTINDKRRDRAKQVRGLKSKLNKNKPAVEKEKQQQGRPKRSEEATKKPTRLGFGFEGLVPALPSIRIPERHEMM